MFWNVLLWTLVKQRALEGRNCVPCGAQSRAGRRLAALPEARGSLSSGASALTQPSARAGATWPSPGAGALAVRHALSCVSDPGVWNLLPAPMNVAADLAPGKHGEASEPASFPAGSVYVCVNVCVHTLPAYLCVGVRYLLQREGSGRLRSLFIYWSESHSNKRPSRLRISTLLAFYISGYFYLGNDTG